MTGARDWWRAESRRVGSDWPAVLKEHQRALVRLMRDDVSIERAWHELNDERARATPQVTIETIVHSVRERGLAALKEPANVARLAGCDEAAKAQIKDRLAKIESKK